LSRSDDARDGVRERSPGGYVAIAMVDTSERA
jgi:hypothetical protein